MVVVKFFISIFRTIVYNFHNTFIYIRICGIYYRYLYILDILMQSGPPFFFKVGVRALLPPKKTPGRFRLGGRTAGKSKGSALLCAPLSAHSHKRLSLSSAIPPCFVFSTVGVGWTQFSRFVGAVDIFLVFLT